MGAEKKVSKSDVANADVSPTVGINCDVTSSGDASSTMSGDVSVPGDCVLTVAKFIQSRHWQATEPIIWQDLVDTFAAPDVRSAKDGPCYLPGRINGAERKKNSVEQIDLLVIDSDRGDDLTGIASRIRELGFAAIVHSSFSHLTSETRIKFDDYHRHAGTAQVTEDAVREYLIQKKGYRPEVLGNVKIVGALRTTPEGIFIFVEHLPIQKGRIIFPLAAPFVVLERMQTHGLSQRGAQDLWGRLVSAVATKLGVSLDEACKDVSRAFYLPAHTPGAPYFFEAIDGRPLDLNDFDAAVASDGSSARMERPHKAKKKANTSISADLKTFAAKYGKTFLLADAMEAEAPDKVRGSTTSVEGRIVECPFDEFHSNAGDDADMASYVMNAGVTDAGGFVWKCHHASCQGRDRLEFVERALAEGWFGRHVLDDPEFHGTTSDPCLEAQAAGAALSKQSSAEETGQVFTLAAECDQTLVRASVLREIKARAGIGLGEARTILKEYEAKVRAAERLNASKPHFTWLENEFDEIIAGASELFARTNTADPRIFRMASVLVRVGHDEVTGTLLVEPMTRDMMRQELSAISTWSRMEMSGEKSIPCPSDVAAHMLNDPDLSVPSLAGIVDAPFFDEHGELVTKVGYHAQSYTYYHPKPGFVVPVVPAAPSPQDIAKAKQLLMVEVDGDFPFADGTPQNRSSKAHAVALKLESFARQLIKGAAPIYLIQKPTPGTGATLFMNAFAQIAYGGPAVPQAEVNNPDEFRKNLTATLMGGTALYWLDNVHHKIDSASLALATTTEVWKDRILGHSKTVVLPVRCTWAISGNNVELSSELARRSVLIRLDANVERPNERKGFRHQDLLSFVRKNRAELVWACLTLVQAWIAAGKPAGAASLASYESWSTVIGGVLKTAQIDGFLENRDELKDAAADEDGPIKAFVQLMYDAFGTDAVPVSGPERAGYQNDPISLLDLYRTNAHELDLGFNDKRPETWQGHLGRAINKHRNQVFEVRAGSGTVRVKLRAERNTGGALKRLELVK